jgi:hypothetical protein
MEIVLYPRAAASDRLRVWIGAFATTGVPNLNWFLDGNPTPPVVLREISSVRPDELLPPGTSPGQLPRVFAGVYEFRGLRPATLHTISAEAGGQGYHLEVRTLPENVPDGFDQSFNVLLVSCFHQAEDRAGLAGNVVSQLRAAYKPDLTLLMGDQVYLDLPTLMNFPDNASELAEKFEADYRANWRGPTGYAKVLSAAPSISIPDDHEYWNNYPHVSPIIGNSFTSGGRLRWRQAATALYEGFQLPYPNNPDDPFIIEVAPLSFFVADTRSQRDFNLRFLLTDAAHEKLRDWVDNIVAHRKFGIFVTGQSLFSKPVGAIQGAIADYEPPNYGDYRRIILQLRRIIDEGRRPLICITGDVHWGRVVEAGDITTGKNAITEIISSPSSLVTTAGSDTVKEIGSFFGSLFGKRDPWPRHSDPAPPPDYLASAALGGRFPCSFVFGQKGNHVTLLSFRQAGGGVECRVTYWPIHPDSSIFGPIDAGIFEFTSA